MGRTKCRFTVVLILSIVLIGCDQKENVKADHGQNDTANVVTMETPTVIPAVDPKESEGEVTSKLTPTATLPDHEVLTPTNEIEEQTVIPAQSESSGTTQAGIKPEDSSNLGLVASDGDYLYFWSGSSSQDKVGDLCKMKNDGSGFCVLSDDGAHYINIINDKIYYVAPSPTKKLYQPIYEMKKDGSDKKVLIDENCTNLIVTEQNLYFINELKGFEVCQADLNGDNIRKLDKRKCYKLQYNDGYLYYIVDDGNALYRLKVGAQNEPEHLLDNVDRYIVHDQDIFFLKDNHLKKYSLETKKESLLYKDSILGFTVNENRLYCIGFFNKSIEYTCQCPYDFASLSLDGKDVKMVKDYDPYHEIVGDIYYINDYIYYSVDNGEGSDKQLVRFKNGDDQLEQLRDYIVEKE